MAFLQQIIQRIAKRFPGLPIILHQAGIEKNAEEFVRHTILSAFYLTTILYVLLAILLSQSQLALVLITLLIPIVFFMLFGYFLRIPDALIKKREREINQEIVFAGRFLVVELESGVPLYDAMFNVSKAYKTVGKVFRDIVEDIDLGQNMEDAIAQAAEYTASNNLRKILWQINNSLSTGADIYKAVAAVTDQITREQIIQVQEYGRKLNPIAMFYMLAAVILPSLGVTMLIIFSSFLSITIDLSALMVIVLFLAFIQFMFVSFVKSSRPAADL